MWHNKKRCGDNELLSGRMLSGSQAMWRWAWRITWTRKSSSNSYQKGRSFQWMITDFRSKLNRLLFHRFIKTFKQRSRRRTEAFNRRRKCLQSATWMHTNCWCECRKSRTAEEVAGYGDSQQKFRSNLSIPKRNMKKTTKKSSPQRN